MRFVLFSIATLCLAFSHVVTQNTITLYQYTFPVSSGEYALSLYQDVPQTNGTGILLDYLAPDLIYRTTLLDEGSDWYFVSAGQDFSFTTINSGAFVPFNIFDESYHIGEGNLYLGVTTRLGFTENGPNRSVVGWAPFNASPTGLTLLDSAVAYDASGITIGTLDATPIPEPASYTLGLLCLSGGYALHRRSPRPAS